MLPASMVPHAYLFGGFFSCPGAWPDAIQNGAPPIPFPRLRGSSRLGPYASLRITGQQEKGRQYCWKSPKLLADWPLPLVRKCSAMLSQPVRACQEALSNTLSILRTLKVGVHYR